MRILLLGSILMIAGNLLAQDYKTDDILGHWLNEEQDGKVEIYKENGKYYGKLVWLKFPIDEETGKPKLDKHNPDDELKKRPSKGIILMNDFVYDGDGEWDDGEIYDPKSGKTYSCYMKLESMNKLKVRGFIGVSLIGRTTYWTRTEL
ncbi:MAG: DUF2147 domain-containing protein [Bacteroidales bacterium]